MANITEQRNLRADFVITNISRQGAYIQYTITLCTLYPLTHKRYGWGSSIMIKSSLFFIYLFAS